MRAMTFDVFERRYQPIEPPQDSGSGDLVWNWEQARGQPADRVWTILDCDGKLYLAAGFHIVNCTKDYFVGKVAHDFTDRAVRWA